MLLSWRKSCRRWSILLCRKQPSLYFCLRHWWPQRKACPFQPTAQLFPQSQEEEGSAGSIGRLLFYQHASLQPKAKLKYNTNEDEWLWITLRCTVVPRVPPTILFSLFSHFWAAKRSQGLALWRRGVFFVWPAPFAAFSTWPSAALLGSSCQLRYGWFLSHLAIRLQLLATKQDHEGHGHLPWEHGRLPPCGSAGHVSPSAVPRGAGRAVVGPEGAAAVSLCDAVTPPASVTPRLWRRVAAVPLPVRGGITLSPLVSSVRAQWPRCSVWEPAVSPRWHGRHAPPPGRCAAGLRLHRMAAVMLQLLIATASSVITARCRQCGHPPLVLCVCSEESSFALFGAVFYFQNFLKICPWMPYFIMCLWYLTA